MDLTRGQAGKGCHRQTYQLIDHLLLVPTLAAFEEQLKEFLPKEERAE